MSPAAQAPLTPAPAAPASLRTTLLAALPLALAIGVFGVIYGAAATGQFGPELTIATSLLIFSGSVQFAVLGLLVSGTGLAALLLTVVALNSRNLVLGAVLRPRIEGSVLRRALLAWFLLDESFGLAVTARRQAARVLLISGGLFWTAWQVGTVLGVLGATAVSLVDLASAIFPVLFIGLAAITARGLEGVLRAGVAAALVAALALFVPPLYNFAPVLAAILVALPRGRERDR